MKAMPVRVVEEERQRKKITPPAVGFQIQPNPPRKPRGAPAPKSRVGDSLLLWEAGDGKDHASPGMGSPVRRSPVSRGVTKLRENNPRSDRTRLLLRFNREFEGYWGARDFASLSQPVETVRGSAFAE